MNQPESIIDSNKFSEPVLHNESFFRGSQEGEPVHEVLQAHQQLAKRLYEIITDLAYNWNSFYQASTEDDKQKAEVNIRLLEAERALVLGQLVAT